MTYKKIFAITVIALMVFAIGCSSKKTGVKGRLILQTGQTGDVRGSRVRLFIQGDTIAIKEVASDATGTDQTKSEFEITDVLPNYYYLLAWKDLNNTGVLDNGDIVGVHGGEYRPGYGGTQLQVSDGKMTDAGDITMYIYRYLYLTVTRYVWEPINNEWISFYYKFNDECNITGWRLKLPNGTEFEDDGQYGETHANVEYRSPNDTDYWWTDGAGGPAPTGTYIITISGNWVGGDFTLADTFNVTH